MADDDAEQREDETILDRLRESPVGTQDRNIVGDAGPGDIPPGQDAPGEEGHVFTEDGEDAPGS